MLSSIGSAVKTVSLLQKSKLLSTTGALRYLSSFENIIVEKKGEKSNVALITLNRPKALNALNRALMTDLANALDELEADKDVAAIVLTGSQKAFAAGADIKEMENHTFAKCVNAKFLSNWDR